ncbi:MAG: hypothetical protein MHPSP_001539, partial [Paramarteilia canceri]
MDNYAKLLQEYTPFHRLAVFPIILILVIFMNTSDKIDFYEDQARGVSANIENLKLLCYLQKSYYLGGEYMNSQNLVR